MSGRPEFIDFDDMIADGVTAEISVGRHTSVGVQVIGSFEAQVKVQGSLRASGDDSTWNDFAILTKPGFVRLPFPAQRLRLQITNFVSGTVQATVSYVIEA